MWTRYSLVSGLACWSWTGRISNAANKGQPAMRLKTKAQWNFQHHGSLLDKGREQPGQSRQCHWSGYRFDLHYMLYHVSSKKVKVQTAKVTPIATWHNKTSHHKDRWECGVTEECGLTTLEAVQTYRWWQRRIILQISTQNLVRHVHTHELCSCIILKSNGAKTASSNKEAQELRNENHLSLWHHTWRI